MLFDLLSNPGEYTPTDIVVMIFSLLVVLLIAFPIHECSHGLVAKILGDPTAEQSGRLTLNPFSHLDPMGTIGMLLFGIGWAKPVPVNPSRCTRCKPKTGMMLTAAAGPVSNVLMSYIFMVIYKLVYKLAMQDVVVNALNQTTLNQTSIYPYLLAGIFMVIQINVYLAVFNLLPIPPFDGSRIFLGFLPEKYYFKVMKYERIIMVVILLLMFTGILSLPLNYLTGWIINGLNFTTGFLGPMMIFVM